NAPGRRANSRAPPSENHTVPPGSFGHPTGGLAPKWPSSRSRTSSPGSCPAATVATPAACPAADCPAAACPVAACAPAVCTPAVCTPAGRGPPAAACPAPAPCVAPFGSGVATAGNAVGRGAAEPGVGVRGGTRIGLLV